MSKLLCIIILYSNLCASTKIVNLNGEWIVSEDTNQYKNMKATVPGGIYSDLMNNGIIGDIFYGNNDVELKWIQNLNWVYYKNVSISSEFLNQENVNLIFEGLDTFSSIIVNGNKVGSSENMFVQYIFDIKKYLNAGINEIEVHFSSPVKVAKKLHEEQSKNYTIPPTCPPLEYNGECHVNMIRKMQSSFAWDWGPSFPSIGIWKNVYIEAYNDSVIRYVVSDVIDKDTDHWTLNVDIYMANNNKNRVTGRVKVDLETNLMNITKIIEVNGKPDENGEIMINVDMDILKAYVNSWWPNGYGASKLYNFEVTYVNEDKSDISIKKSRIGFRKIELVQEKLDLGLTFYFKVNDVPIFMKGTNEIPIDILPEKGQNKTKVKQLLLAAHASHINMIRVWGGGVYESDYFYELTSELGILIWQDFMFACAMYPTTDSYLKNVVEEVRHQVRRLYSHSSLAVFSGNNENEGALRQNWYNTAQNYSTYYEDYVKLYITTIKSEFLRITHNRGIFITSSPTNGKKSDSENYVAENPGSSLYGDVHFYNYILNPFNTNFYPTPRFSSEYGYQSLPSLQSWFTVTNNTEDTSINSIFMNHRQHHPLGNLELKALLLYFFAVPEESNKYFNEAFIYYTQIAQAFAVKIETEHYRSCRSSLEENGEGYTMGALYWQLNDVWVAPSWSSIDYLGRWKMLQYHSMEFFAPVIVTSRLKVDRTLEIYLISDLPSPLMNLTISITVYNWNSCEPVNVENLTKTIESGSSQNIKTYNTDDYLSALGCGTLSSARTNCFFYLSVTKNEVKVSPDNFVFPDALKDSNITTAHVKIDDIRKISDAGVFIIEISTDQIALFVWLESLDIRGNFSENGFLMVQPKRVVFFNSEEQTSTEYLLKTITITHLLNQKYFTNE
ncbi:beta-mannosidase-like isoform X1 [Diorhabda carinulata]|uniref:beta-mannosidase-like isoform X1 n=1 Tax=Diorhabda carinulata TaxID=1163345 RepID=UPI0025A22E0E|nr:beta-mannosidase-like isoform X1 [Diorhabda carinulata]